MSQPNYSHAVNPLPPVVVALFLVLMRIEVSMSLGAHGIISGPQAIGWRLKPAQPGRG